MAEYTVIIGITNETDSEALDALEWLKTEYGSDMKNVGFQSSSRLIRGNLIRTSFNDSVTAIQDLKTEFTDRLTQYDFHVTE